MRRLTWAALAAGLLLLTPTASAQIIDPPGFGVAITAQGTACTTAGACALIPLSTMPSVTIQIVGTFSATLQFEGTSDGQTWGSVQASKLSDGTVATSTTTTGQYTVSNTGLQQVRVRCSSFVSGVASVTGVRGYAMSGGRIPFFPTLYTDTLTLDTTNQDVSLARDAANVLAQRRTTNAQTFRLYNTYTDASNYERLSFKWNANTPGIYVEFAGTGTSRGLEIQTTGTSNVALGTNSTTRWAIGGSTGHFLAQTDNTYDIGATGATRPRSVYLGSPAVTVGSGTGITVNDTGQLRELTYKVTVASTAFICNAVTCDVTIATLPASSWLMNVTASLTTTYACASVCTTSTLSMVLGKGSGGAEYLASLDADAATGIFGDADAELGTLLVRAAAIQGGTYTAGTQTVVLRLTSGTGVVGTGAATNLSQGSITFWLKTLALQ
jgi:hypothetical protein